MEASGFGLKPWAFRNGRVLVGVMFVEHSENGIWELQTNIILTEEVLTNLWDSVREVEIIILIRMKKSPLPMRVWKTDLNTDSLISRNRISI